MNLKKSIIYRWFKIMFQFGGILMVASLVVDYVRAPTAPVQFEQQVQYDLQNEPQIIAQLSYQKPMLLYFWGSWCHYCAVVSPNIQQFADEGTTVLGVALKSGNAAEVKAYLNEKNYTFPTINDPTGEFARGWNIQATPAILMIKGSKIIHHTTGYTSYWGLKLRLWLAELFA